MYHRAKWPPHGNGYQRRPLTSSFAFLVTPPNCVLVVCKGFVWRFVRKPAPPAPRMPEDASPCQRNSAPRRSPSGELKMQMHMLAFNFHTPYHKTHELSTFEPGTISQCYLSQCGNGQSEVLRSTVLARLHVKSVEYRQMELRTPARHTSFATLPSLPPLPPRTPKVV